MRDEMTNSEWLELTAWQWSLTTAEREQEDDLVVMETCELVNQVTSTMPGLVFSSWSSKFGYCWDHGFLSLDEYETCERILRTRGEWQLINE